MPNFQGPLSASAVVASAPPPLLPTKEVISPAACRVQGLQRGGPWGPIKISFCQKSGQTQISPS